MKILIFGNGYVGNRCANAWSDAELSAVRVTSVDVVREELERVQPDAVLNAIGVKGKPNVDWCDEHPLESMQGNVMAPLMIAQACQEAGVYMLHVGSGCIFYGKSAHEGGAWRESDHANPDPTYTHHKWAADLALMDLKHVGIARIRMPIDRIPAAGNLLDKLASYSKVIDVENSITVVDDMVDVFHQLLEKKAAGIFHVTNPGMASHREILRLYKDLVDPAHACEWIQEEALVGQQLAKKKRSNNILSSENLAKVGIHMRDVHDALRDTVQKYAEYKKTM